MSAPNPSGDGPSYEELTAALEEVMERLEQGDLSLDAALATYEQGVILVRACNDLLDRAELRVSELAASAVPGEPPRGTRQQLFPFELDDEDEP
ncbi:MAG TPA: exodeoxyribonuclease VII small subunit [Thermomicrobiaceae bacterium]|nr:exodeoxyribonuclease VII small subunit [Thermomicrobiaceae bacterium]